MKVNEIISLEKFKKVFPECKEPEVYHNLFDNILEPAGITTKEQICMFLAQCGHESGQFTITSENLNYSAQGLRGVFGKYFPTEELANEYARNPEKIGNRVYANRIGNGDEASGDGFRYHGRGAIQITGKENYKAFSEYCGVDVVADPDLVSTDKSLGIKSAIWFWNKNKLNNYANDILACTKKINGGTNGLEERTKFYNALMS